MIKIGFTNRDPETRAGELSAPTGVPGKWSIVGSWFVQDAAYWEEQIFSAFSDKRETGEFFKLEPNTAVVLVKDFLRARGAVDESGLSPAERARLVRGDRARITVPEQEQRERARIAKIDAEWEKGWPIYILPWCEHHFKCQKILNSYTPPFRLLKFWTKESDVISDMKKWAGYSTLIAELPLAFTLNRKARYFREVVSRGNAVWSRGGPTICSPTNWDIYHPCRKKDVDGPFTWLFFLNANPGSAPDISDLLHEIRLVVQEVFGFDGETAERLLAQETAVRNQLLALANKEVPPEFSVPYKINA